jgi:hypothetical protein
MVAQVLAAPLVVVTSNMMSSIDPHSHAVAGKTEFVGKMRKGSCGRNRFRQKAVEISNIFREALGLPLIKTGSLGDGKVRILPFIGTSNIFAPLHGHGKDMEGIKVISIEAPHDGHHPGYHHHKGHHHHNGHHHRGSFISRIHYSLMNLGRWEGRVVAFVLGKISQSLFL